MTIATLTPVIVRKRADKAQRVANADDGNSIWIMTTGDTDRDGETVDPEGLDFSDFDRNPVVVDNHQTDGSVNDVILGKVVRHWLDEVGEGTNWPQPGGPRRPAQMAEIAWNTATAKGREAKAAANLGMLNGGSISFLPKGRASKNQGGGNHYPEAKLLEFTLCSVPSNPSAIRVKSMNKASLTDFKVGDKVIDVGVPYKPGTVVAVSSVSVSVDWGGDEAGFPTRYDRAALAAGDLVKKSISKAVVEKRGGAFYVRFNKAVEKVSAIGRGPWLIFVGGTRGVDLWSDHNSRSEAEKEATKMRQSAGGRQVHVMPNDAAEQHGPGVQNYELRSQGKTMKLKRKLWVRKSTKSAWLLKSDGGVDQETAEYLKQRGLDDVQIEDQPPPKSEVGSPEWVAEEEAEPEHQKIPQMVDCRFCGNPGIAGKNCTTCGQPIESKSKSDSDQEVHWRVGDKVMDKQTRQTGVVEGVSGSDAMVSFYENPDKPQRIPISRLSTAKTVDDHVETVSTSIDPAASDAKIDAAMELEDVPVEMRAAVKAMVKSKVKSVSKQRADDETHLPDEGWIEPTTMGYKSLRILVKSIKTCKSDAEADDAAEKAGVMRGSKVTLLDGSRGVVTGWGPRGISVQDARGGYRHGLDFDDFTGGMGGGFNLVAHSIKSAADADQQTSTALADLQKARKSADGEQQTSTALADLQKALVTKRPALSLKNAKTIRKAIDEIKDKVGIPGGYGPWLVFEGGSTRSDLWGDYGNRSDAEREANKLRAEGHSRVYVMPNDDAEKAMKSADEELVKDLEEMAKDCGDGPAGLPEEMRKNIGRKTLTRKNVDDLTKAADEMDAKKLKGANEEEAKTLAKKLRSIIAKRGGAYGIRKSADSDQQTSTALADLQKSKADEEEAKRKAEGDPEAQEKAEEAIAEKCRKNLDLMRDLMARQNKTNESLYRASGVRSFNRNN